MTGVVSISGFKKKFLDIGYLSSIQDFTQGASGGGIALAKHSDPRLLNASERDRVSRWKSNKRLTLDNILAG